MNINARNAELFLRRLSSQRTMNPGSIAKNAAVTWCERPYQQPALDYHLTRQVPSPAGHFPVAAPHPQDFPELHNSSKPGWFANLLQGQPIIKGAEFCLTMMVAYTKLPPQQGKFPAAGLYTRNIHHHIIETGLLELRASR